MRAHRRTRVHTHTHLDPHVFVHRNDVLHLEAVAWPCADPHSWPAPTDVASIFSPRLPTSRLLIARTPTSRLFLARAYRRRACVWPVPTDVASIYSPCLLIARLPLHARSVPPMRRRSLRPCTLRDIGVHGDCTTAEYSPDFFATCVTWTSPFFRKPSIATKQPYLCVRLHWHAHARAQNAHGLGHARTDVQTEAKSHASLSHAYNARELSYDYKRTRAVAVLFGS